MAGQDSSPCKCVESCEDRGDIELSDKFESAEKEGGGKRNA